MEKNTKKSYKDIITFINASNQFLNLDKNETKLRYALIKMNEKLKPIIDDGYFGKIQDLKVDFAAVDSDDCLIISIDPKTNENIYKYTKEEYKKLNNAIKQLALEEVEIDSYIVTSPTDLHSSFIEIFKGFVI